MAEDIKVLTIKAFPMTMTGLARWFCQIPRGSSILGIQEALDKREAGEDHHSLLIAYEHNPDQHLWDAVTLVGHRDNSTYVLGKEPGDMFWYLGSIDLTKYGGDGYMAMFVVKRIEFDPLVQRMEQMDPNRTMRDKGFVLAQCECSCADVCPQGKRGFESKCWIWVMKSEDKLEKFTNIQHFSSGGSTKHIEAESTE